MPTYPYACTACGHAFEVQQSFSDPSLTECPECSGRLRKVFSSVGVVFKGSGFYRTDSRSGKTTGSTSETKTATGGTSDGGSSTSSSGTTGSSSGSSTPSAKPAASTPSTSTAAAGS